MNRSKPWILLVFLFCILAFKPAVKNSFSKKEKDAKKRFALVIGNNDYQYTSKLGNPVNDAQIMKAGLENVGFQVSTIFNGSREEILSTMRAFRNKINNQNNDVLFFFAGHGIQHNNDNWLVPTDANPHSSLDVEITCISLSYVLKNFEEVNKGVNIVILDACRVNPFKYSGRTASGGLTAPKYAPKGTFIAFSTSPNQIAQDGNGENSLYSSILSKAIQVPDITIEQAFKIVRNRLIDETGQIPWENSSILGEFYFNKTKEDVNPIQSNGTPEGMVLIPGGQFEMGDVFNEGKKNERPTKIVNIEPFYMGKYEVSNAEYCEFLNDMGNRKEGLVGWTHMIGKNTKLTKSGDKYIPIRGYQNHPIVNVNWYGARAYCIWKSDRENARYRLPTEAEWEYAAREGGKKVRFGNGKNIANIHQMNYDGKKGNKFSNSKEKKGRTVTVNSYKPNALGLYNMAGNVWEFCSDIYEKDFSKAQHKSTDFDLTVNSKRILKGGGYWSKAEGARISNKFVVLPSIRLYDTGFRCVREIE